MKTFAAVSAMALVLASPALALDFMGGNVTLGYSGLKNDMDYSRASLTGQAEFGITPAFSLQTDVGVSKFFEVGETEHNLTLHGIWHNGPADLGVFYGGERIAGDTKDFYGFELGQQTEVFDVELYVGRGENFGWDGIMGGVSGRYALTPQFGLGLAYDRANIERLDMSRVALKADYAVRPDITLGAEIGSFRADLNDVWGRETYVGVNAKMSFGAQGGTSFNRRGLLNIVPGL
ncbi:hypothetical protein [Falsirhodobacter sp. 20TX0035]|uniref:hypothetical protein n=1 Tax=Falsirhodobacter sp. 20TX0035 TaxID=3022019 RepID=UPI00232ED7C3|nr:hypothetical protein [Falsirhodobacter sp. 20TX0035]MDB6452557.1 hypothetical protein [Falsirhodobacter sp. 20TX0035]